MPSAITKAVRCVQSADSEPVTLDGAKAHARVDIDDDDALITAMISAARQQAENKTGRVICKSTWEWVFQAPLSDPVEVPLLSPCYGCAGVTVGGEPLSVDAYSFFPSSGGINEAPLFATFGPLAGFPTVGEVVVTLTAGWPLAAIPDVIKQWILVRVTSLYEQRESFTVGANFNEFGRDFVDGLLDPFVIPRSV